MSNLLTTGVDWGRNFLSGGNRKPQASNPLSATISLLCGIFLVPLVPLFAKFFVYVCMMAVIPS
jgi:hypothetical protein